MLPMRYIDLLLYLRARGWSFAAICDDFPATFVPGRLCMRQWAELAKRGFTIEEYAAARDLPVDEAILDLVTLEQLGVVFLRKPSRRSTNPNAKELWYIVPKLPRDENGNEPLMPTKSAQSRGETHNSSTRKIPKFKLTGKRFRQRLRPAA